jgi:hypothetical protein
LGLGVFWWLNSYHKPKSKGRAMYVSPTSKKVVDILCIRVISFDFVQLRKVVKSHETNVVLCSIANVGTLLARVCINYAVRAYFQIQDLGDFRL